MQQTSILLTVFDLDNHFVINTHTASMCSDFIVVQHKPVCMVACMSHELIFNPKLHHLF
jgi:hypothetical protein